MKRTLGKSVSVILVLACMLSAFCIAEAYKMEITSLQMRHSILMESLVA